jgi:hypothetical protein
MSPTAILVFRGAAEGGPGDQRDREDGAQDGGGAADGKQWYGDEASDAATHRVIRSASRLNR